jgi:hypothetical protein
MMYVCYTNEYACMYVLACTVYIFACMLAYVDEYVKIQIHIEMFIQMAHTQMNIHTCICS